MNDNDLLTLVLGLPGALVALPAIGAALVLLLPKNFSLAWGMIVSLAVFGLSLPLWFGYGPGTSGVRFEVDLPWIYLLNAEIRISMGVDGISLLLILLTTLLGPLALLSASRQIHERRPEFVFWALLMEAGILGALLSLDLVLFYLFLELALIPLWFLIGIWGGPRRLEPILRSVLFNAAGSILMLGAIIYVVLHSQQLTAGGELIPATSRILELSRRAPLPWVPQALCFLAFTLGFAVKVPLFPFHAWVADAQTEAPTSASLLLTGVLLKLGIYGMLRLSLPLFPAATRLFAPWLLGLALIGVLYGGLLAWAQRDLKRLVAFGCFSQLGFVILGLFALEPSALTGALLFAIHHGLVFAALFLLVGMLQERRGTTAIEEFGGLSVALPRFGLCLTLAVLASIGVPGSAGFVGEFMILSGLFRDRPLWAALATIGIILGAVYMLSMTRRVLFGPLIRPENRALADIGWREGTLLAPLLALILWIGLQPAPFTGRIERSLAETLQRVARFEPPPPGVR